MGATPIARGLMAPAHLAGMNVDGVQPARGRPEEGRVAGDMVGIDEVAGGEGPEEGAAGQIDTVKFLGVAARDQDMARDLELTQVLPILAAIQDPAGLPFARSRA
jgi:hypothetical protein